MPNPSPRRIVVLLAGVPYQGLFQEPYGDRTYFPLLGPERIWDSITNYNPTKLIMAAPVMWTDYVRGGVVALCRQRKITLIRHTRERAHYNRERAMLELRESEPTPQSEALAHLLTHLDEMETAHFEKVLREKDIEVVA